MRNYLLPVAMVISFLAGFASGLWLSPDAYAAPRPSEKKPNQIIIRQALPDGGSVECIGYDCNKGFCAIVTCP